MSTQLESQNIPNPAIVLMTETEARECVSQIKAHIKNAREKIYELYEREGWRALNYPNWRECVVAEFGSQERHLYRQLQAAQVEVQICPMGQIGGTPERQLRPLTPFLKDVKGLDENTTQKFFQNLWQVAQKTAPTGDDGKPVITASHVQSVADVVSGILVSGGLDDGSGEVKPLGVLIDAAITEETYERAMRQKEHIKQSREFRREAQIQAIENMPSPEGRYHVIVADPPWSYDSRKEDPTHRARNQYPSMDTDSICEMNVSELALDDCVLWLWTTNAFMRDAYRVAESWGFEVKTILTWAKDRMGLGDWLRGQTEHCLMCVKGRPVVRLTNQTTLLHGPLREHSRKPDEFFEMVEQLCPGAKCELFSRQEREGWSCFGAEVEMFT